MLFAMARCEMLSVEEWYWRDRLMDDWADTLVGILELFRSQRPLQLSLPTALTAEEESLLELSPEVPSEPEEDAFCFSEPKKKGPETSILDQFMWMYTS